MLYLFRNISKDSLDITPRGVVWLIGFLGLIHKPPHQTLRHHKANSTGKNRIHTNQVDHPAKGRATTISMEARHHQVASNRRLNGGARCIDIADLTHHHDIWIETKHAAQALTKASTGVGIDWDLRDASQAIFDWIL